MSVESHVIKKNPWSWQTSCMAITNMTSLERHCVSNHRQLDYLLNSCFFQASTKKTPKFWITGPLRRQSRNLRSEEKYDFYSKRRLDVVIVSNNSQWLYSSTGFEYKFKHSNDKCIQDAFHLGHACCWLNNLLFRAHFDCNGQTLSGLFVSFLSACQTFGNTMSLSTITNTGGCPSVVHLQNRTCTLMDKSS